MLKRCWLLSGAICCITATAVAQTDDTFDSGRTDPLFSTGLVMAGLGAATLAGGVAWRQTAEGPEHCGWSGCFQRKDHEQLARGSALTSAGVGIALSGGVIALMGLGDAPPASERRSEPMMVLGSTLTSSGTGLIAGAIALIAANPSDSGIPAIEPIALFGAGGVALAAGIPLWAAGMRSVEEEEAMVWPGGLPDDPDDDRPSLVSANVKLGFGIPMTLFGAASCLGATALGAMYEFEGASIIVWGPIMLAGSGILATGIGLWAKGGSDKTRATEPPDDEDDGWTTKPAPQQPYRPTYPRYEEPRAEMKVELTMGGVAWSGTF